jgi:hypothetical protein
MPCSAYDKIKLQLPNGKKVYTNGCRYRMNSGSAFHQELFPGGVMFPVQIRKHDKFG